MQSQGAHAVPAGQAGQLQTAGAVDPAGADAPPLPALAPPETAPVPVAPIVVVVVAEAPQLQLQGGQGAPAGQAGQAQVQVPLPVLPVPAPQVVPPDPPVPPLPPAPVPPVPDPQSHAQGGQASPGAQAGQAQVQVPPPPVAPPVPDGGGGQSQATGGQAPSFGQASGWTQPQPPPAAGSSQQYPPPEQSWPTGQSAGVAPDVSMAVQAQRRSTAAAPAQDWASLWTPHGSAVAQTAAAQSALGGHTIGVQAQALPAVRQVSSVAKLAHGSATVAAASCWGPWF